MADANSGSEGKKIHTILEKNVDVTTSVPFKAGDMLQLRETVEKTVHLRHILCSSAHTRARLRPKHGCCSGQSIFHRSCANQPPPNVLEYSGYAVRFAGSATSTGQEHQRASYAVTVHLADNGGRAFLPIPEDRDSKREAEDVCASSGMNICTTKELCPEGDDKPPVDATFAQPAMQPTWS